MNEECRGKEPVRPFNQIASDFLLRSRWAQKIRQGGYVRIPGMNPLVLLVVVVALVGGGLYVYRTYVSGPASKCSEINEAFDLISIVPPPELIAVPKALAGSSLAPVLLTSMSTAREAWGKAVATQNRSFAPGDPDAIGASWQSWVALKRATVLDEENC